MRKFFVNNQSNSMQEKKTNVQSSRTKLVNLFNCRWLYKQVREIDYVKNKTFESLHNDLIAFHLVFKFTQTLSTFKRLTIFFVLTSEKKEKRDLRKCFSNFRMFSFKVIKNNILRDSSGQFLSHFVFLNDLEITFMTGFRGGWTKWTSHL